MPEQTRVTRMELLAAIRAHRDARAEELPEPNGMDDRMFSRACAAWMQRQMEADARLWGVLGEEVIPDTGDAASDTERGF